MTYTGPSANTLMATLEPFVHWCFDIGLVLGELRFQVIESAGQARRSIMGVVMMGFGGILADGCSTGNGARGSSIFPLTAWIALIAMWVGGVTADWLIDWRREGMR